MAAKMLSPDVRRHNETLITYVEPGDLIEFPRGPYSHWAVYIGNEEVVHLAGDENDGINGKIEAGHFFTICGQRFRKAIVKVENFWDVVLGTKAKINNTKDKKYKPLPKSQIIANALERLGRVGYNVLFDNCEHFASLCRYGQSKSDQVDTFLTGMAVVGAIGATAGILYGLSRSKSKEKQ